MKLLKLLKGFTTWKALKGIFVGSKIITAFDLYGGFLFTQEYVWLEQPRDRCDTHANHTKNGCKNIANPKSKLVTNEVS